MVRPIGRPVAKEPFPGWGTHFERALEYAFKFRNVTPDEPARDNGAAKRIAEDGGPLGHVTIQRGQQVPISGRGHSGCRPFLSTCA